MHIKRNNKETNTYLQGLRPFSKSLPKNVKIMLKKNGYGYSEIISRWNNLVGNEIATSSYPKSIKIAVNNENNTLVLEVKRGSEVLIEYSKNQIIDKINSFFGYRYINKIRLESTNTEIKKKKNIHNLSKFYNNFEKKVKEIKNKNIQESFFKLIKSIRDE